MQPRLTVNLVPEEQWGSNLHVALKGKGWDEIRKRVYAEANHRCVICGGRGPKWPVEAHEVWSYVDGVQKLEAIKAFCPACHEVQHIGRAMSTGHGDRALRHLREVNGWDFYEANEHVDQAFDIWEERNRVRWMLDLSLLWEYGIDPAVVPLRQVAYETRSDA
jgi:hypothetical protein